MPDLGDVDGRPVVMRSLCGSACQGLAAPSSDLDWKGLFLPSPDDLMQSRMRKHTGSAGGADFDDHDIRALPDLLWKSNTAYLEVLFPSELELSADPADSGVVSALRAYLDRREDVAEPPVPVELGHGDDDPLLRQGGGSGHRSEEGRPRGPRLHDAGAVRRERLPGLRVLREAPR